MDKPKQESVPVVEIKGINNWWISGLNTLHSLVKKQAYLRVSKSLTKGFKLLQNKSTFKCQFWIIFKIGI